MHSVLIFRLLIGLAIEINLPVSIRPRKDNSFLSLPNNEALLNTGYSVLIY